MPSDFPKRGEVWRHYKGTLYKIDRITYDEESGRVRVTYFAAHESEGDPEVVHGRLIDVFLGYDPETHRKRFTFEQSAPQTEPGEPEEGMPVFMNGRHVVLSGLALEVYREMNTENVANIDAAFKRGQRNKQALIEKVEQAFTVLCTLIARNETGSGVTISQREWTRLRDYFSEAETYSPDFLPWPRAL